MLNCILFISKYMCDRYIELLYRNRHFNTYYSFLNENENHIYLKKRKMSDDVTNVITNYNIDMIIVNVNNSDIEKITQISFDEKVYHEDNEYMISVDSCNMILNRILDAYTKN